MRGQSGCVPYGRDPGNARRPDIDRFEAVETIVVAPARTLFVGAIDFDPPDWD